MEGSPTGRSRRRTPTTPGARRTRSRRWATACARRSVGTRRRRPGRRLPVASTAPVTTRCSCAPPTSAPLWELLTLFGGYSRTTSSNGTTGCRCPRPCQYVRQSWTTGSSSSPSGCRRRSRCAPWRRRGCCARPRAPAPCHMRSSSGRRQGCGSHWGRGCAKGCATPHGTGLPARSRGLPSPSTRCSSVRSWTATIAGPAGRVACRPCCPWRCGTTASSERPRRCRGRARRAHRGGRGLPRPWTSAGRPARSRRRGCGGRGGGNLDRRPGSNLPQGRGVGVPRHRGTRRPEQGWAIMSNQRCALHKASCHPLQAPIPTTGYLLLAACRSCSIGAPGPLHGFR